MKKGCAFVCFMVLLPALLGHVVPVVAENSPPATEEALTNARIIDMVNTQLSEPVIISKIKASKTSFDLSVNALIILKSAGVSDNIVQAMLETQRGNEHLASNGERRDLGLRKVLSGHACRVFCVSFNPDGKTVASADEKGTVLIWDAMSGDRVRTLSTGSGAILSLAFSPDGKTLASGSRRGGISFWNTETGKIVKKPEGQEGALASALANALSVAFSPDGRLLACGRRDKVVVLYDVLSGSWIKTLLGHSGFLGSVNSVAFSPDGRLLASGGRDKRIIIWDAVFKRTQFERYTETGGALRVLTGHTNTVSSVAFSPDGKTLASGSTDKTVILWNPGDGEKINVLKGHSDLVNSVAFSPDGRILASGSRDKSIILWNPATGQRIETLTGHSDEVVSVAFSPDGKTLASGSRDQTVILWDVAAKAR